MAQYTYDPTQMKVVPLDQARVVTYIVSDPAGIPASVISSAEAARESTGSASGAAPQTGSAASYGLTDTQVTAKNAVRDAQARYDAAVKASAANPGNSPDAVRDRNAVTAAKAQLDAAKAAIAGTKSYENDPDVMAARALQASAAAEVAATDVSIAETKASLATIKETNAANKTVVKEVAPVPTDFTTVNGILMYKGAPYSGSNNGKYYTDGKEVKSKGAAWVWNGTAFVQPPMPKDGKTYTWNDNSGWVISPLNTATVTKEQTDSIAALTALLGSYGIGDLSDAITKALINGYSPDTIQLIMQDPNSNDPLAVAFQKRFPANKVLAAQGKPVLSPGEYLAAEKRYTEIMQSYGVAGLASRSTLSDFIGNSISATEVSDRISLAVNRVQNADPDTKKMLATYYPMLNTNDIVSAMLSPKEFLPALQRKVQIAEIGGAALAQGLNTSINAMNLKSDAYSNIQSGALGAQQLAELGVTKEQARLKYEQVAEVAPRAEFLSSISGGADYTRLQAEQEAFLGTASAKRARENLTKMEQARFAGSAGTSKASLTSSTKGMLY